MRTRVGRAAAIAVTMAVAVAGCSPAPRPATSASSPGSADSGSCVGAAAVGMPAAACPLVTSGPLRPNPRSAFADRSQAYHGDGKHPFCVTHPPAFTLMRCDFLTRSDVNVALIGNSHAAQWFSAVEPAARNRHWHLTTYLGSQCALADVAESWTPAATATACRRWIDSVTQQVSHAGYDLVVMADKISQLAAGTHTLADSYAPYYRGYRAVLQKFRAAHEHVVVIRTSPLPGSDIPACVAGHPSDYRVCDGSRAKWVLPDPAEAAATSLHDPTISVADLSDHICEKSTCHAVVGGVLAYYDQSHLTATFTRTLAPYLEPLLARGLAARR